MNRSSALDVVMSTLLIIGGLNWGSIALLDFNFVEALLGRTQVTDVVYALVGLAALYSFFAGFSRASRYSRKIAY